MNMDLACNLSGFVVEIFVSLNPDWYYKFKLLFGAFQHLVSSQIVNKEILIDMDDAFKKMSWAAGCGERGPSLESFVSSSL